MVTNIIMLRIYDNGILIPEQGICTTPLRFREHHGRSRNYVKSWKIKRKAKNAVFRVAHNHG